MTVQPERELTSAESGLLYAFSELGASNASDWQVDEIAVPTLAELFESVKGEQISVDVEQLNNARLGGWYRRRGPAKPAGFRRLVDRALRWPNGQQQAAREAQARRLTRRAHEDYGGDLTPLSEQTFDVRVWLEPQGDDLLGLRLVVVGAVLVGALDETRIRREIAAMMRQLPAGLLDWVEQGLQAVDELPAPVGRRVFEVYRVLASQGWQTDEKLALLGLVFVVSAAVFRQNRELNAFERLLPQALREHCRKYRTACVTSGKPQLAAAIAQTIQPLFDLTKCIGGDRAEVTSTGEDDG